MNKTTILFFLIFLCSTAYVNNLDARNLSSVLEAVNELERKLTRMIQVERSERTKVDKNIRKELSAGKPPLPKDSALMKTVEDLKSALLDVRTSQKILDKKLTALSDSLVAISAKGDDNRVREMAAGLKKIIDELKSAMEITGEEQEAMELGGVITLDVGVDPADAAGASAEIGEVNLSAVVNLADELTAFITLLAEGDMEAISIDEALVEWKLSEDQLTLLAGRHALYHGLLSTHLISDPLMLDNVELITPGITSVVTFRSFSCALGAAYIRNDAEVTDTLILNGTEVTREEIVLTPEDNYFAGVVTVDYTFFNESTTRLSSVLSKEYITVAAGTGLQFGKVAIDLEWFNDISDYSDIQTCGAYGGIAVTPIDGLETAFRYDMLSPGLFESPEHRIGFGASFGLPHDLYIAAEYGHHIDADGNGAGEIALQFGLESTVKLPGFQRKTLTRK